MFYQFRQMAQTIAGDAQENKNMSCVVLFCSDHIIELDLVIRVGEYD